MLLAIYEVVPMHIHKKYAKKNQYFRSKQNIVPLLVSLNVQFKDSVPDENACDHEFDAVEQVQFE